MSQHDMNIANQGFPAFRADLNNALAALCSLSSGGSAPTAPLQYQLWLDSSVSPLLLKIFDGADWIPLCSINTSTNQALPVLGNDTVSGDVVHGGTISAFASTGIDDNASALRLTINDSETVINDSGAVHDTRIEGDLDANLLVVKAATDKVGIGTNAPSDKLQVAGVVRGQAFTSYTFTLADNAATSIDFGAQASGWCFISSHYNTTTRGMFCFRVGASVGVDQVSGYVGTTGTGSLSGATGVDGEFTVRAHSDNKLYFENRLGSSVSFSVMIVARHG
jgi:hypothetical protein